MFQYNNIKYLKVDISYFLYYYIFEVITVVEITSVRHSYPEKAGFKIERRKGHKDYTFLHFLNKVKINIGGKVREIPAGSVIIYNIGTPQYFLSEEPLVHNWMHFKGNIIPFLRQFELELDRVYTPANTSFITPIIREIENEFLGKKENRNRLMDLKFEELLLKLSRASKNLNEEYIDKAAERRLRDLRGEIFENFSEKWTIESMAKKAGFSESRFYAVYKAVFGVSPINDLINVRLNKGKTYLTMTNKSIEEISELLGYDNTTHFIRQFKDRVGLSPTRFRKQNTDK